MRTRQDAPAQAFAIKQGPDGRSQPTGIRRGSLPGTPMHRQGAPPNDILHLIPQDPLQLLDVPLHFFLAQH
jgi:hypothetical protein